MPAVKGTNAVSQKLAKKGLDRALAAHKDDETDFGSGGKLPAGVVGVAELRECRLGEYKTGDRQGEPFVYFNGIAKTPEMHNGIPVVGARVDKIIPLCDDPASWKKAGDNRTLNTFDDYVAQVMNELRKLGIPTNNMATQATFEATLAAAQDAKPHFKFHTWEPTNPQTGKPTGNVRIDYDGAVNFTDTGSAPGVDDQSGGANDAAGEPTGTTEGGDDWDQLAEAADGNDLEAAKQISAACKAAGIDPDDLPSWAEAVAKLKEAQAGSNGHAAEGSDAEAWTPKKGENYPYKARGTRTMEDCEVTAVFAETLNLKRLKDNVTFKAVPWTADPPTINGVPV